jgi:AraC-like DNA-binding protein
MRKSPIAVITWLLIFVPVVSSSLPQEPLTAQQLLDNLERREFSGKVMDFDFDNVDLEEIFRRFEEISGLEFVLDSDDETVRKFTFMNIEWDRALHLVLLNLDLELERDGQTLRVTKARPRSRRLSVSFLAGVVSSIFLIALALVLAYTIKKRNRTKQQDKKPPLTEDRVDEIRKSLSYLFEVERIFRDQNLSLNALAERLELPAHQLSWVINNKIGKTFSDFLNYYRVEDVKKRLADSQDREKTILEIAFDSGFSTKSSFNKTFKDLTGKTPRDYRAENSAGAQ